MPRYNYEYLSASQLREYARDLLRTASRVSDAASWMDEDKVETIRSRNSAIGVRAQDYAQKYANAVEEAVRQYKYDNRRYRPGGIGSNEKAV